MQKNGFEMIKLLFNKNTFIFFIFASIFTQSAKPDDNQGKDNTRLIVFHIDLNSVALKEDYIRKWLKNAADMGYNAILWEVEGKIKWSTCPECVNPDAFSKEQFKKILSYSRSLGLEPVPLLQTIGHAEYVLRNKKYFSYREDPSRYDCYATCKPEVKIFLKKWINEYLDLFGEIKYFHLGGDEAYVFATSPECASKVKQIGEGKLYAEYISDIAQHLIKKGIHPCIWDDMIMKYPNAISDIPKNFIIWVWNYWDNDATPKEVMLWNKGKKLSKKELTPEDMKLFPEILDDTGNLRAFYNCDVLKRLGYNVVLSSSARWSGDGVFAVRQNDNAANIIGAAKKVVEDNLLGTCVTSWAVRIPNYETQKILFYLAPLTIKNSKLNNNELISQSSENIFGISGSEIMDALNDISFPITFADKQSTGIMWTGMKDSRAAPPGYIKNLINTWRNNDEGKAWRENIQIIKSAPGKIAKGLTELYKFIPKVNRGFNIIEEWEKAGYFQYWAAVTANDIIENDNRNSNKDTKNIVELLNSLRLDYNYWAKSWMTDNSAKQNTGLIYDAIINYFSNN
jgi:hypothetical protein